jgi:putative toxin-antitoxin system antitoxin component (TIGR02293 family)
MDISSINKVLGCEDIPLRSDFDLMEAGRRGVKKCSVLNLTKKLNISREKMSSLLDISKKTIDRKPASQPFNRTISEQVLRIAEVLARGEEVFEDDARFLGWLNHPSPALGGKKPIDLLDSAYGRQIVLDEITRIEHGIFA